MKALVLAGGVGSRLRPITYTSAKQLIPVANRPILFFGLESIAEAGIKEVGIVVGDTGDEIVAAVGNGSRFGVNVSYLPQERPLGLAHAVKIARDFVGGSRFVVYLGDNLIRYGITSLVGDFETSPANCQVLLAKVPHPERFGVAELSGDRVVRLEEKPAAPRSDYALVGVYMFDSHVFEAVDRIVPSRRGELEITDAIQYLIDHDYDVRSHVVDGWWKDTGTLADLLEANRLILEDIEHRIEGEVDAGSIIEGPVSIGRGARVVSSRIIGPAVIGADAEIKDSSVGPFASIGPKVIVESSEIDHTIVMEGAEIRGVGRVTESLIGRDVRFHRSEADSTAHRVMLGDKSDVGLC